MIQPSYDADCEECWIYFADGQTFADREVMEEMMIEAGWVIIDDLCWCPDHVDKAE